MMLKSIAFVVVAIGLVLPCVAQDKPPSTDPIVTWRHMEQPVIELQATEIEWSNALQEAWMQCLLLDEVDLKREAADALTVAQSLGMTALPEFRGVLLSIIQDESKPISCRVSAAQAFVAMGKPPGNDELSSRADRWPPALSMVLEPALAAWDYPAMRDLWLQRLQADQAHPALVRIAIEALGIVGEARAEPALIEIMQSPHSPVSQRLVAARSLARLPSKRLIELSEKPLDDASSSRVQWLLGVQLLREQDSPQAIEVLERFADLQDRAVAGEALRQLLRIAPQNVVARAEQNINDGDANVRAVTVDALATSRTPESVRLLATALDDAVPRNRRAARDHLLEFASDDALLPKVVQKTTAVLNEDSWRGIEQSLIVLTKLQQRGVRERLFQLLEHPRAEVMETAAWSIKEVAPPEWSEQCLEALQQHLDGFAQGVTMSKIYALMHLLETMGVLQIQDALELLRTFVPKDAAFSPSVRVAAVWSIGEILEDQADPDVVSELESRLNDVNPILPEYEIVRGMAAVSLGKMQSKGSLEYLAKWRDFEGLNSFVGRRSAWAIFTMTGEPIGDVITPSGSLGGWFVQPLN